MVSLGLPEEPRRFRGDAGLGPAGGPRADARPGRGRGAGRQHLRLHRQGQAGVGGRHPRDGRVQEDRRLQDARRGRLPGRALPRRAQGPDSGNRPHPRHRRRPRDRRGPRRPGGPRTARAAGGVIQILRKSGEAVAAKPGSAAPHSACSATRLPASTVARLCRPISTTPRRRGCSRRRGITPTSRSPRAATTSAASASSPSCAATTAAGPTTRSCARPRRWRRAASRNCCSSRRTRPSTASIAASAARWRACSGALQQVDGIEWIRLLYLYPTTIGDDVLDAMAAHDKVCRYVDLPLQHASDAVLKRMKRPGTRAGYEKLLDRIRTRVPGVTLRTTVIVGYPGETADDFAELQAFVKASSSTTWASSPTPTRRARPPTTLADDVPAAHQGTPPVVADDAAEAHRRPGAPGAGSDSRCGCSWTARRRSTSSSCGRGRRARPRTSTRWST